ncbi:MAG: hypothetical protein ACXACI_12195 [Candidatus Hodarchaeales archaeon]
MKKHLLLGLSLLLLLAMSLAADSASAQNGGGKGKITGIDLDQQQGIATISTENMTVSISSHGNVPKFSFYANNENTTRFHVHFVKIMEFNDSDGDGLFNESEHEDGTPTLGLASVSWNLSDFSEEGNLISFNFTSDSISQGQGQGGNTTDYGDLEIVLAIHFDTTDGSAFKFDILMANWPFANEDNMLALRWDLTWDAEENGTISTTAKEDGLYLVRDGEDIAYFTYVDTAQIDSANVDVTISYDSKMSDSTFEHGIKAFLSYPNFNGSQLIHDPTLGVLSATVDPGDTSSETPGDTSSETAETSVGEPNETNDHPSTIVLHFPAISRAGFLMITVVSSAVLAVIYLAKRKKA